METEKQVKYTPGWVVKDVTSLMGAAAELLAQLRIANDNIALIHSDYFNHHGFSVERCDCSLAKNWRNNQAVIAKAEGK